MCQKYCNLESEHLSIELMKRRKFIKNSLATAVAVHPGFSSLVSAAEGPVGSIPSEGYDLIIHGGNLAGCFAAVHAAKRGWRVLLIEKRTVLGHEITAALRPWLNRDGFEIFQSRLGDIFLPDEEQDEIGVPYETALAKENFGTDIPLFNGSVKKQLVNMLLTHNVNILIMTGVWGIVADVDKDHASGLVSANKFGLQFVRCRHILDTTTVSIQNTVRSFSLEFYNIENDVERILSVPASLGLDKNTLILHKGKRLPGQFFVEFQFLPKTSDAEHEARRKTEMLCHYLLSNHPHFSHARLAQMALEPFSLKTKQQPTVPIPNNTTFSNSVHKLEMSCQDVTNLFNHTQELINAINLDDHPERPPAFIHHSAGRIPLSDCKIEPIDDVKLFPAIQAISFDATRYIPLAHQTDVLIAGGGTAGAMAAVAALEKETRVTVVEFFPEPGGTCTIGRVTGYYWGYKETKLFDRLEREIKNVADKLGGSGPARMLYLREKINEMGGRLLTNSIVCGVIKEKTKVTGLLVEKDGELCLVSGNITIDATGDGDVAVFAGASFEYGDDRMKCTQNYSQWDVNPGLKSWEDSTTNRDHDILMNHYLSELQRGYILSHLKSHYYDFVPMLTVRESRRIVGDYTVTLKDVLQERHYHDTICLANSDFDPHYFGDTIYTRIGCLLPHGVSAIVEIPYRAIVPKGIDHLLISGKAISQTHNAMQFTRMSFDIMTLGYVTGWIAAAIVKTGCETREFDVRTLHGILRSQGILPESCLSKPIDPQSDDERMNQLIADLISGEENSLLCITMLTKESVEPKLLDAFQQFTSDTAKLRLGKALAWFHNPVGNSYIVNELKECCRQEKNRGQLPWEYYRKDKDTPYWTINQDIVLLGLSFDPAVLPVILDVARTLPLNNPPVQQERIYDRGRIDLRLIPFYNRIVNLCLAIEQMPSQNAIPVLHRFLDDPYIKNHISKTPEKAKEHIYGAILETRIAATLACCGDKRGFNVLVDYLQDVHYLISNYAKSELEELTGKHFGYDGAKWSEYLNVTL